MSKLRGSKEDGLKWASFPSWLSMGRHGVRLLTVFVKFRIKSSKRSSIDLNDESKEWFPFHLVFLAPVNIFHVRSVILGFDLVSHLQASCLYRDYKSLLHTEHKTGAEKVSAGFLAWAALSRGFWSRWRSSTVCPNSSPSLWCCAPQICLGVYREKGTGEASPLKK